MVFCQNVFKADTGGFLANGEYHSYITLWVKKIDCKSSRGDPKFLTNESSSSFVIARFGWYFVVLWTGESASLQSPMKLRKCSLPTEKKGRLEKRNRFRLHQSLCHQKQKSLQPPIKVHNKFSLSQSIPPEKRTKHFPHYNDIPYSTNFFDIHSENQLLPSVVKQFKEPSRRFPSWNCSPRIWDAPLEPILPLGTHSFPMWFDLVVCQRNLMKDNSRNLNLHDSLEHNRGFSLANFWLQVPSSSTNITRRQTFPWTLLLNGKTRLDYIVPEGESPWSGLHRVISLTIIPSTQGNTRRLSLE